MGAALSLAAAISLPLGGGMAVGMLTRDEIKGWYKGLQKPKWNPPNWVFGPAWSVFYASMGAASWITARKGVNRVTPLVLYFVQLGFNFAWTPLFFKAHKLDLALADSTAMLGIATAATVTMSRATDRPAAILPLMVPYLCWITFATALNGEILRLNPDERVNWEALGRRARDKKDQAAAKVQEGAKAVQQTASQVAAKAGEAASEVARKAREDVHDLGQIVKEAVGGDNDEGSKPMTS